MRNTSGIWFQTSAWWGPGVWLANIPGRDLGRVAQEGRTWSGWKDKYPPRGSARAADVTGCRTRQDAAEALRDLWEDSHGPVIGGRS